mmetsp:Transcript_22645/g.51786  ORF Transcript_22645/g.51786 Transcript_22645/m.51786 type:complete len:247 (-) Transcript_22645:101-841(-)
MATDDPYYTARDEVQRNIKKTKEMMQEWQVKLTSENTAKSKQFQDLHADLQGEIQSLQYDLQDIADSIEMVEKNRVRFKLDDREISSRKAWLRDSRSAVQQLSDAVNSGKAKAKIESDQRQLLGGQKAAGASGSDDRRKATAENDSFLSNQRQDQQQIVAQQEDHLDELAKSARRLGENARVINVELQDQQRMLEQLEDDIDKESEKLNFVMKRIGKLMKTNDNKQICMIIGLFVFMLVLVFLVIQ